MWARIVALNSMTHSLGRDRHINWKNIHPQTSMNEVFQISLSDQDTTDLAAKTIRLGHQ
ncbi:hypothetical protein GW12_23040 [Acinetobacter sp. HR7]|nr:hypothetical protein GW12_23040 [Acinetobacter sp. HR7]